MEKLVRKIDLRNAQGDDARMLLRKEWLLTNGLGGYASGTISGAVSRRYHGWLIAALPAPLGRIIMFNHLAESLVFGDGRVLQMGGEESAHPDGAALGSHYVTEFRLENQLPVWRYEVNGIILEKRALLVHGQNTVHIRYYLLSEHDKVTLELRPSVHFRRHDAEVSAELGRGYQLSIHEHRYEIASDNDLPLLRMTINGENALFTHHGGVLRDIAYQIEAERGYHSRGLLWGPGYFTVDVLPTKPATFIASTEDWKTILAVSPEQAIVSDAERRERLLRIAHAKARTAVPAELVLAADQFIVTPAGRVQDAARARASGDEVRTIIAGYHWFTDWGRDTMISLEGLTLVTGRRDEAGWILRTFAHYIRDGLIPNFFPDGENQGLYHTADATLWFFHALDRFLEFTSDRATLKLILPKLREIIECHLRGTHFGIAVDPGDGLLKQGAEGYQLTWMDAKVDGWVVTPRRGKAVEINALWYNALRLMEGWSRDEEGEEAAQVYAQNAQRARESFNKKFWNEQGGFLYDVVEGESGNDSACRPNQILAISLKHAVLDEKFWKPVLEVVKNKLLTPIGLRSLGPDHPDFKAKYFGDLRARDAAYHQGTVWAWLVGPFIDAWLKTFPDDRDGARKCLAGFESHLSEACIGTVSEIFDAEPPFTARGCIAQAWSVAEVLRCWVKIAD